jgi:proteasome-associated ATPase
MTMLNRPRADLDLSNLWEQLVRQGDEAPSAQEKLQIVQQVRQTLPDVGAKLDERLLAEIARLRTGLTQARRTQDELRDVLARLSAPPWHPAIYLGATPLGALPGALVSFGGARRVVGLASGLDADMLAVGDEVLLSESLNVIMRKADGAGASFGDTAIFERYTGDGRLVLRHRDEELVVQVSDALRDITLAAGDRVRWDRQNWLAVERLERSSESALFLEDTPQDTFERVGGLSRAIAALTRTIALHREHADTVRRYRLRRKGSVLLVGPPGTGKTLVARALANWLAQISRAGRSRFMNIKPGSLHSVWYSQSEANYREAFRLAREAGEAEPEVPVVMFFDEVDAIGSARGDSLMRVDDRVLTAFMTELDGLESRGNVLVVAATNRHDALDPALLRPGRLGDLVLEIPRPDMQGAREILGKHLPEDIPYSPDGLADGADANRRDEVIRAAVSRLYAPNGEGDLVALTFRDGRRRAVAARDLVSGASLAKIAGAAIERACQREIDTGETGVRLADLDAAIDEEVRAFAHTLTPVNCRRYLTDLPQDVDVVRVDAIRPQVERHRYLRSA